MGIAARRDRGRVRGGASVRKRPKNNYIIVILDSCRYDSFVAARPRIMRKLGRVERRWSYASWTAPSHYNLLCGLLPHSSPANVFASEYYKRDFLKFSERLGVEGIEFKSLIPKLYFPAFLNETLGYRTHAMVSLPVLNPKTILNHGFDSYRLMDKHNDMRAMVREMKFREDRPSFYLLNVGETHYPYALPDEPPEQWPRISGVHGVFKHLDDHVVGGKLSGRKEKFFDDAKLRMLRERQVRAVKYLDGVVEELFDTVPKNTWITITADHGELFGEGGYFGHGPINHEKVFEVPFVEGKLR
ncbi:MAG TPA: sulfatase-like hydrolase/transferase [Bryobacteraceae bacterium]|nr:sulfatase-like hydrolase/transferase [Bryobacteraceae bacterium]HOQ45331.1 sulfatase-like hydrolase/transferase [Bryobacteraceae bacterium]HPQ14265.1 sulfatase-like hydrolase/transferase [Bryobacteraceae bacterium]HPU71358.1 sulfatase-like hydrolase/transferase [Bryobacteraceae bacterium]